jgi:tetratricopeptide (TPR) repeat protein
VEELKPITREGIPAALQKAERYRLLNESSAAESICLDVLEIDPKNQHALAALLLSITDQFASRHDVADEVSRARAVVPHLESEYERRYYCGIIAERRARARLDQGALGAADVAAQGFREAMAWYEKAEAIRPAGNDDAILRWNTCVRVLHRHAPQRPTTEYEPALED